MKSPRPWFALFYLVVSIAFFAIAFLLFWGTPYATALIGASLMLTITSEIIAGQHHVGEGLLEFMMVVAMIASLLPEL